MPIIAITRAVSPTLDRCELGYLERQPIDVARAAEQHRAYEARLTSCGITVVTLPAEPAFPDAVFVEDPAIVLDQVAVMTRIGAESRRGESATLAAALERYRPLCWIEAPGTLDGGDVVRIESTLYAGRSKRTNAAGIEQLAGAVAEFGYTVQPVDVHRCLHLKSGCTYLGRDTVLVNRDWIDAAPLAKFRQIDVGEPGSADVLAIGDTIIMPASFPRTAEILRRAGWRVDPVDVSELQKAEAGVTCMSLIFEYGPAAIQNK
jgi:dimethylargininase